MQQAQVVSGFSELKDLLIRTFQIERPREKIRLYFTDKDDQLLMHDYHDQKFIIVIKSIRQIDLIEDLSEKSRLLCLEALMHLQPAHYLNEGFLLYGFFRL